MTTRAFIFLAALLVLAGCGEDEPFVERSAYEITSWTYNPDSCDQEGPDVPRDAEPCRILPTGCTHSDQALYVERLNVEGQFINMSPCPTVADCAGENGIGADVWLFSGDAGDPIITGQWGRAMDVGGSCDGEYYELRLTAPLGSSFVFETLTRPVTGLGFAEDGRCDVIELLEVGPDQPCTTIEVISADFAEDLVDERP